MHPTREAVEEVVATIANAVAWLAIVIAALAAVGIVLVAAIRWFRDRRASTPARETLFVGRWGVFGPELYLVGKGVRRLAGPAEHDRHALAFARRMLAEVTRRRQATQLARAFADARLEPLPPEGFVLSTSEVAAWLEARKGVGAGTPQT